MRALALVAAACLTLLAVACGDEETFAPTATPQATATPGVSTELATAGPATRPAASPTPAVRTPTPLPRVDGTIPAQGAGGTALVTIKANPDPAGKIALLKAVRSGAHPEQNGWDRIVFEFQDVRPAGKVEYVTKDVQCGSGADVKVPGSAMLKVTFTGAQAHDNAGKVTIGPPFVNKSTVVGPGNSIMGGEISCDFEGVFSVALGIDGKQAFNVRFLDSPTRVVIDVKW